MPALNSPIHANMQPLEDGSMLYYFGALPDTHPDSFKACLNLNLWRAHLEPFAVVCIDAARQEILLIRDHLGIEPLYYCEYLDKRFIGQSLPEVLEQLPKAPPLRQSQIDMLFSHHKYYSDETLYEGIYRVEPGHLMHFKTNQHVKKQAFWRLEASGPSLQYKNQQDYFEHFESLIDESMRHATKNHTNIAAEFSAGLDSSAVYCAATNRNLSPKLYMHVAMPNTRASERYVADYEKHLIEHFRLRDIQRIDATDFDPITVFNQYANWYAGPAPYLFTMFANPVHKAVSAGKHPILLSGFGGDQCVSGQLPTNFFIPELIKNKQYRDAWQAINTSKSLKKALLFMQYTHPRLYAEAMRLRTLKKHIRNLIQTHAMYQPPNFHPYQYIYYPSVSATECALLQGIESHEIRMRVEYSSIVSRKMGFQYRYPLLYPKLLEFMISLPTKQKRYDGQGRYLIRQYLAKHIPSNIFNRYQKRDGLGIVPSTFDLFQTRFNQGYYQDIFKDLPFSHYIQSKSKSIELRNTIKGFMLKHIKSEDKSQQS